MLEIKITINGEEIPSADKRACDVNSCGTFISSISLCLELAGSYLAQTLLGPSKFIRYHLFLLNLSFVLVNARKSSAQSRVVFIKP